jgi:hypothetical protein
VGREWWDTFLLTAEHAEYAEGVRGKAGFGGGILCLTTEHTEGTEARRSGFCGGILFVNYEIREIHEKVVR